jgi:CDP-diacylglycerol--serine O-phosphatidyltransferase
VTLFRLLHKADAFTIANAALGFLAITYISDGKYAAAMALVLLAVIADGLDGIVARRFGGGKEKLGDYLDIMADYLSFCVAPAILFYQVYFDVASSPLATLPQDILVGAAAGAFMTLGLLRLARHVAHAGPEAGRFQGLPTTGAGFFVTMLVAVGGLGDVATSLLVLSAAGLMVTEIPYPKVRGWPAYASGLLVLASAGAVLLVAAGSAVQSAVLLAGLAGATLYATSGFALTLFRVPHGGEAGPPTGSPPEAPVGPPSPEDSRAADLDRREFDLRRREKAIDAEEEQLRADRAELGRLRKQARKEPEPSAAGAVGESPTPRQSAGRSLETQEVDPDA